MYIHAELHNGSGHAHSGTDSNWQLSQPHMLKHCLRGSSSMLHKDTKLAICNTCKAKISPHSLYFTWDNGIIFLSLFKTMVFQFESVTYWFYVPSKPCPRTQTGPCLHLDLLCFCSNSVLSLSYIVASTDSASHRGCFHPSPRAQAVSLALWNICT